MFPQCRCAVVLARKAIGTTTLLNWSTIVCFFLSFFAFNLLLQVFVLFRECAHVSVQVLFLPAETSH